MQVGDRVHYVSHGSPVLDDGTQKYPSVCRAAFVTAVVDETQPRCLSLAVLNPTGMFFNEHVFEGATASEPGTWHSAGHP
jgi:hypothetical protein